MPINYNISYGRLIRLLLPSRLKTPVIRSFLQSAFNALLQKKFDVFRADSLFRLNHNGQVCYLRAALNAKFASILGNVRFDVCEPYGDLQWVFANTEAQSTHIYALMDNSNVNLYAPNEDVLTGIRRFVIYVPSDLYNEPMMSKIRQFVDSYRLISSRPIYKPINS